MATHVRHNLDPKLCKCVATDLALAGTKYEAWCSRFASLCCRSSRARCVAAIECRKWLVFAPMGWWNVCLRRLLPVWLPGNDRRWLPDVRRQLFFWPGNFESMIRDQCKQFKNNVSCSRLTECQGKFQSELIAKHSFRGISRWIYRWTGLSSQHCRSMLDLDQFVQYDWRKLPFCADWLGCCWRGWKIYKNFTISQRCCNRLGFTAQEKCMT